MELYGIYEMEYDDDVLEYYDQPIRIQLQYRARSGRKTTQWHTPDFYVIRQSSAGFEEWKPVTALETLKVTMPERYQPEPSGGWRCPPGQSAAQVHGLFYRIRTNEEVHPLVIQNLKFLQDFWIHVYEVPPEQEAQVLRLLTTAPGITVRQLTSACDYLPVDVLWAMLTDHRLFTDLSASSLMQWDQVRLFRSQDEAEKARERAESVSAPIPLFTRLSFDGRLWEAEKQGDQVVLRPEVGAAFTLETSHLQQLLDTGEARLVGEDAPSQLSEEVRSVLLGAGPTALAGAQRRLSTILAYLRGESVSVTKRTVQNWLRSYREAERATVPMSALPHPPSSSSASVSPLPVQSSHTSFRIERASYRDPVGEQIVTTTSTKCTYLGIIEVTRLHFQEAGTTCVKCPTCGARRTLKSPKDRPHFPSHPKRLTPPPKGERRWIEREEIWKVVEDC